MYSKWHRLLANYNRLQYIYLKYRNEAKTESHYLRYFKKTKCERGYCFQGFERQPQDQFENQGIGDGNRKGDELQAKPACTSIEERKKS